MFIKVVESRSNSVVTLNVNDISQVTPEVDKFGNILNYKLLVKSGSRGKSNRSVFNKRSSYVNSFDTYTIYYPINLEELEELLGQEFPITEPDEMNTKVQKEKMNPIGKVVLIFGLFLFVMYILGNIVQTTI